MNENDTSISFNFKQVTTATGEEFLASMPHKFRKHVWIKRGDYVVTEEIPEGNKVRAEIVRILMKDHIRFIMQNDKWPSAFIEQTAEEKEEVNHRLQECRLTETDDSDSDDNNSVLENSNRCRVYIEESDESSNSQSGVSEDSEEDSHDEDQHEEKD